MMNVQCEIGTNKIEDRLISRQLSMNKLYLVDQIVLLSILSGDLDSVGINVQCEKLGRVSLADLFAAAMARIPVPVPTSRKLMPFLKCSSTALPRQARSRCLVRSRAKRHVRLNAYNNIIRGTSYAFPRRCDHKTSHTRWPPVLFPFAKPIGVFGVSGLIERTATRSRP